METITFETDKFNLTKVGSDFINPCCFGQDVAEWFKPILLSKNVTVNDLYQEDWGWEIFCSYKGNQYYLGIGGFANNEGCDLGEWRIIFTKKRSFTQLIFGKNKLSSNEPIISLVNEILNSNGFNNKHACEFNRSMQQLY